MGGGPLLILFDDLTLLTRDWSKMGAADLFCQFNPFVSSRLEEKGGHCSSILTI